MRKEAAGVCASVFLALATIAIDRLLLDLPNWLLWLLLGCLVLGFVCSLVLFLWPRNKGENAHQVTIGDKSPTINTSGGKSPVQISNSFNTILAPESPALLPWTERAGGPQFRLSPSVHQGRLVCDLRIDNASPVPGNVEARWSGAGTGVDWVKPMLDNVPRGVTYQKFQMKPVPMAPRAPSDQVVFEVRFNLEDGPHGGRWTWPIRQHEAKGHWILDSHLGSGVHQPKEIW